MFETLTIFKDAVYCIDNNLLKLKISNNYLCFYGQIDVQISNNLEKLINPSHINSKALLEIN